MRELAGRTIRRLFSVIRSILTNETWLQTNYRQLYDLIHAGRGTELWLAKKEIEFGGFQSEVERRKVSPLDPRSQESIATGGMFGGDRFIQRAYGGDYARHLRKHLGKKGINILEFGILKGTGLAIWCELFPESHVLGFDIDLSHYEDNKATLKSLGAFRNSEPSTFVFDQFQPSLETIERALGGKQADIVIDDGFHSVETILNTLRAIAPYLSKEFTYFIEDNSHVHKFISRDFTDLHVYSYGLLTVLERR